MTADMERKNCLPDILSLSAVDFRQKTACLLCPCPHLTAYWTPPPACPRRVCCCETSSKMPLCVSSIFRDAKTTCIFLGTILVAYYFIMDIFLYMRFKTVNIVEDSKAGPADEVFSSFTHLSVKALMNDHTSQYVINPSAEYFDQFTKFSTTFSFVTPNMISITHLILGLVSGKFIASENLYDRRVGVVIFEIRSWLDSFDGVVYRSQSGTHLQFQSVKATTGYYVDTVCDALGGVFLCFGILFYLWKRFDPFRQELPTWNKNQELGLKSGIPTNGQTLSSKETYSKKYLFWKVFCYGICLACAGKFWDLTVADFTDIFQKPLTDPKAALLQNELCHSTTTIVLFYLWRLLEGQALLQYILVPIIIDKIWGDKNLQGEFYTFLTWFVYFCINSLPSELEFLNYTQYILLFVIVGLYLACLLYIHHLRTLLNM